LFDDVFHGTYRRVEARKSNRKRSTGAGQPRAGQCVANPRND
jgi:hypothetical protein